MTMPTQRVIAARAALNGNRTGFLLNRYAITRTDPTIKTLVIDETTVEIRFNPAWVESASDLDIQTELAAVAQAHTPPAAIVAALDDVFGKA